MKQTIHFLHKDNMATLKPTRMEHIGKFRLLSIFIGIIRFHLNLFSILISGSSGVLKVVLLSSLRSRQCCMVVLFY